MAHTVTSNATDIAGEGEGAGSNYLTFALVLAFFFVGLTGVVVCHVLKKKGYRFTTSQADDEDDDDYDNVFKDGEEEPELQERHETVSENEDTVGHIIQCIMKNEANSDALNAMVHHTSIDSDITASPPLTPISPVSPRGAAKLSFSEPYTSGGGSGGENKLPLTKRPSQRKSTRRRPSQVTVLSVGRFRVTKCDKSGKDRATVDSESSYQSALADVPSNSKGLTHSIKEETED
ncbi:RELT-like protein 1 [Gambusia affinis]|uniref:RELT-like protein 1 n=1 Tax=Gambusia affinis TaxID=33528 RepID=UPI001CDCE105|nr:RELT-like protein 1 [Gambusia affinis]